MTDVNPRKLKIKREEFYAVYGISVLLRDAEPFDREYFAGVLQPIAEKYLTVTEYAVRTELRHLRRFGYEVHVDNKLYRLQQFRATERYKTAFRRATRGASFLRSIGFPSWNYAIRRTVTMEQAYKLFTQWEWDLQYGGTAWAEIAKGAIAIRNTLPIRSDTIERTLLALDRLNDLEHNNDLYLANHCTFNLLTALNHKATAAPNEIMQNCPLIIQQVSRYYKQERVLR